METGKVAYLQNRRDGLSVREFRRRPEGVILEMTDSFATHNIAHRSTIPRKGEVGAALNVFWLKEVLSPESVDHHLLAFGSELKKEVPEQSLRRRSLLVRQTSEVPIEFVFRFYLAGSLGDDHYRASVKADPVNAYGLDLPLGVSRMTRFPNPVLTPKDAFQQPLSRDRVFERYPLAVKTGSFVSGLIQDHLNSVGLELIDITLKFGFLKDGQLLLVGNIGNPDSMRVACQREVDHGREPSDLLAREAERQWGDGLRIPLLFPQEMLEEAACRYQELFYLITGRWLDEFQSEF